MWASSARRAASGVSSHAAARRLRPVSVIASSGPSSNRTTSTADLGCPPPTASRPADIRCTISTGAAASVSNSSRFARRPHVREPLADQRPPIGGSIVFTVAKCATGTSTDRLRAQPLALGADERLQFRQLRHPLYGRR